MAWTFSNYDDEDASNVLASIDSRLNGLSNNEAVTAKVGLSDQRHGHSYGVVFYNSGAGTPLPYTLTGAWNKKIFTWEHNDQYVGSFGDIATFLNGETQENLTPTQAAYAHFCMSDYESGTATGTVFWQDP